VEDTIPFLINDVSYLEEMVYSLIQGEDYAKPCEFTDHLKVKSADVSGMTKATGEGWRDIQIAHHNDDMLSIVPAYLVCPSGACG
jgi:hypothetical protein